jgi:hypothetical protein
MNNGNSLIPDFRIYRITIKKRISGLDRDFLSYDTGLTHTHHRETTTKTISRLFLRDINPITGTVTDDNNRKNSVVMNPEKTIANFHRQVTDV